VLALAVFEASVRHRSVLNELANWDGLWYARLARDGYPAFVSHGHTTLGFFPLYPLIVRRVAGGLSWLGLPYTFPSLVELGGVVVSLAGGLISTVLVQRLASDWWGERAGRRAVAFFCLFPGSIVFSMVYAEGVLIALAAGCLLALERRRWFLAGALAGLATASEPQGLVLVLVCAVAAWRYLRRAGWQGRSALSAAALSLSGIFAFASFLWVHTGSPFATLDAQRDAWHERFDLLAIGHQVEVLSRRIAHPALGASIYNPVGALGGTVVLLVLLGLLIRKRRTVPVPALVWTLGIAVIALTSERLPPNARMLLTAFPAVLVIGVCLRGWRFWLVQCANATLLVLMAWLTFNSHLLPP
jgi:hypothetical protein